MEANIKASDLRIGNWVIGTEYNYGSTKNRRPVMVESIDTDSGLRINTARSWEGEITDYEYDLAPIPLSPDLLAKAGFDSRPPDEDYEYWGIRNFTIIRGKATDGALYFFLNGYHNDVTIHHLHQLQNLFHALTGEDLQIEPLT